MAITWLHISDFHFRSGDSYDREVVLDSLIKSVRRYREEDGRHPDFIFATGDIAQSGKAKEYEAATEFFDAIRSAAGVEKKNLFLVPGNHDVDRDAGFGLFRTLQSEEDSGRYFQPGLDKLHLVVKQRAFLDWYDGYFDGIRKFPRDSSCSNFEIINVRQHKVGVLLINTAIFCQDDEDIRKLWIGRRCLEQAVKTRDDVQLSVALLHHPLDWMHDVERLNVRALLRDNCDVILNGHMHELDAETSAGVTGCALHVSAGACYQSRKWPNRAFYCCWERNEVDVFPISFVDSPRSTWTTDASLFPEEKGHSKKLFLKHKGEEVKSSPKFPEDEIEPQLAPPFIQNAIQRVSILNSLTSALQEHPVVILAGLSGSGKTYLMAQYAKNTHIYSRVLWYDPSIGESLENLLAAIGALVGLKGEALIPRCKTLAARTRADNILIVIDNYDHVDRESYDYLIGIFQSGAPPCRLVILSQSRIFPSKSLADPFHVYVDGFNEDEIVRHLKARAIDQISEADCRELADKTGGIPFAINLFATLVSDLGYSPRDLFSGAMENATRIKTWFEIILNRLDPNARKLLPYLTLDETPFNVGVVKIMSKAANVQDPERALSALQERFLVRKHSAYRWKVHELIGVLAYPQLDGNQRRVGHELLGKYFSRGIDKRYNSDIDDTVFLDSVRAYRHFAKSDAKDSLALDILLRIAATAKKKGHYGIYLELSGDAIERCETRNKWIDYHHAHCALILGHPDHCCRVMRRLLYDYNTSKEPVMRLSFTRLYAEGLGALRKEAVAEKDLRAALNTGHLHQMHRVPRNQAKSVLAWLLTRMGAFAEAFTISQELLAASELDKDPRAAAVAWARMGSVLLMKNQLTEALAAFEAAETLFRGSADRRGLAWVLSNASECLIGLDRQHEAIARFSEAAEIHADTGAWSIDLEDCLARMRPRVKLEPLLSLITDEQLRMRTQASLPLPLWTSRY